MLGACAKSMPDWRTRPAFKRKTTTSCCHFEPPRVKVMGAELCGGTNRERLDVSIEMSLDADGTSVIHMMGARKLFGRPHVVANARVHVLRRR